MEYIIMCGGEYKKWETPRQLLKINGETLVERTIRLLKEHGIDEHNIAISSNNDVFLQFGVQLLSHNNKYVAYEYNKCESYWCDAFYPTEEQACYLFGDVIYSNDAISKIIETQTNDIEFFASAPPFDKRFYKKWAEPFALKVVNQRHLRQAISLCKLYDQQGLFARKPIMWELWQVIKHTPLNRIDYTNYTVINDYTCDVDEPEDIDEILKVVGLEWIE